jgi:hypothetical protein
MKQNDSDVWKDLQEVKHLYLLGRIMVIGNDKMTDFWKDSCCGFVPQLSGFCFQR